MQLNIERMVRLLQQILETSKSQSGELKLRVAQGDVMRYIQQTALCIEPLMAKNHLDFSVSCQPESMMGWIDTDKLDKIIYNLLSNAAKYTPKKTARYCLDVRTNKNYDRIIIKVRDNGIGIPKEKQSHLFRRFYDGDYRQMQTFGTGLGLSLTRDLVFLHGGDINCESEEGEGTTFTVVLEPSAHHPADGQDTGGRSRRGPHHRCRRLCDQALQDARPGTAHQQYHREPQASADGIPTADSRRDRAQGIAKAPQSRPEVCKQAIELCPQTSRRCRAMIAMLWPQTWERAPLPYIISYAQLQACTFRHSFAI